MYGGGGSIVGQVPHTMSSDYATHTPPVVCRRSQRCCSRCGITHSQGWFCGRGHPQSFVPCSKQSARTHMAPWSALHHLLVLQAVGLVPQDKANGAHPMETDAVGPNKRRRISNRVYVGSSDLSYRREHMEVCSATCAVRKWRSRCTAVCRCKTVPGFAERMACRWKGLCIKVCIKTWTLSRSFGSMPSSKLQVKFAVPEHYVYIFADSCAALTLTCAMMIHNCAQIQVQRSAIVS